MNIEIKAKNENPLLGRSEVDAVVSFEGATPSFNDIKSTLVQKIGCNPDLTVIKRTESKFGEREMSVRVHIYKDPEHMKKAEQQYALKRNKLFEEEKPKEEPKKEEKPEEKKEEKPKEEPKKEEKPEEKKEEKAEEKSE